MSVPDLASDFNGQEGTLCFWVTLNNDFVPTKELFGVRSTVAGSDNYITLTATTDTLTITYKAGSTSAVVIQDTDALSTDEHFIAVTWSLSTGAGQLSYYYDGALVTTSSDIGTWGTAMPTKFKCTMGPGEFVVRHVSMWSMKLTAANIASIYGASQAANVEFIPSLGSTQASIRLINPAGADMYLTSLTISGKRIKAYKPLSCLAFDENTISKYGRPGVITMKIDMPYQDSEASGKAYAEYLLNRFKDPLSAVESMTFCANKNSYMEEMAMKLRIGDRISLQEWQSGLNGSFFINGIEKVHQGDRLDVTLYLQSEDNVYWLIGTAGYSEIGVTTYLGF